MVNRYVLNVKKFLAFDNYFGDMTISNLVLLNNRAIQSRVEEFASDSAVNLALV